MMEKLTQTQLLYLDNLIYLNMSMTLDDEEGRYPTVKDIVNKALSNIDEYSQGNPAEITKEEWVTLLNNMKNDPANANLLNYKITNYKDESSGFRAACFVDNTDNPTDVNVVFRGTGSGTEWADNLQGANVIETDQQLQAAAYINALPRSYGNNITVTGHSKGGNKAQYVTIATDKVGRYF